MGGGINGTGIARDAAGRGMRVLLVEQAGLAHYTSSSTTKLVHGGLRYLEYFQFRLVRESLNERERLLSIAPHLVTPLRFVLPYKSWLRPAWAVRLGLFLYDWLGSRSTLEPSAAVRFAKSAYGAAAAPQHPSWFCLFGLRGRRQPARHAERQGCRRARRRRAGRPSPGARGARARPVAGGNRGRRRRSRRTR